MMRRRKGRDLLKKRMDGWMTRTRISGTGSSYPSCFEFRFRSSTSTIGMEYR